MKRSFEYDKENLNQKGEDACVDFEEASKEKKTKKNP